jgi:hypothetical protein
VTPTRVSSGTFAWLPKTRISRTGSKPIYRIPTGDRRQQLSSKLADYWLNFILEESLSRKTRININSGFLLAGNTSTGALGIETTRGHVFPGGIPLLHDFNSRLTLGGALYGGIANNDALRRGQLQGMFGGEYAFACGVAITFGLLAGKYAASPRVGAQVGFSVDFPDVRCRQPRATR